MPVSKPIAVVSIALLVWTIWISILGPRDAFLHVTNNWPSALTMVFGSTIAGGTSLGGGAVAFPVFTKVLQTSPYDAKVFSLAIQSVGMTSASVAICLTGIQVEWRAIFWGSLGGFMGITVGLGFLDSILPPDVIKMSFTVILTSFAITLWGLNRGKRRCHLNIPAWTAKERYILLLAGFLGGIISGLTGTGIDIVTFSVMVLLFRVSEKIATPTSVILMALTAVFGFVLQVYIFQDFSQSVQSRWLAATPVVVVGAPLGAMLCSLLSRQAIARIVIGLIFIDLVASLILIPLTPIVVYWSAIACVIFSYLNYRMYRTRVYQAKPVSE